MDNRVERQSQEDQYIDEERGYADPLALSVTRTYTNPAAPRRRGTVYCRNCVRYGYSEVQPDAIAVPADVAWATVGNLATFLTAGRAA